MKGFLTKEQILILREAHYSCRYRKAADRIKAILLLDQGFDYAMVAKILMLDDTTIRRYEKEYEKVGVDGLIECRYFGSRGLLSLQQEMGLIIHLQHHTYQRVKAVVTYVEKHYRKTYSVEGMTHLLHRLGFVYKKTKQVPGKLNLEKQEQFKKEYEQLKNMKRKEDRIYFLDATHPQHNNMPFYGWIYKGATKTIKTNSGRTRLNLNGALNLERMDITVLSEKTIDTQAMKRLVLELERKQQRGTIYLLADNASYNHSYEFRDFLKEHKRVQLKYIPSYSPNLNIIERLWRFFHAKHRDKYFETFKEFDHAVLSFFQKIHRYDSELKTLLTDNFQTISV
jgi:transposase